MSADPGCGAMSNQSGRLERCELPTGHASPCSFISAVKFDNGKPPMELLSSVAIEGLAQVLAFGAKKYAADNWRKGMAWRRVIGAAMRHEYQKLGLGTDDRWRRS